MGMRSEAVPAERNVAWNYFQYHGAFWISQLDTPSQSHKIRNYNKLRRKERN